MSEIEIQPYIGYGFKNYVYCYGRVLKKRTFYTSASLSNPQQNNFFYNLINSYKRIESDEIPHCEITFTINGFSNKTITNSEGFYLINEELPFEVTNEKQSVHFSVSDSRYSSLIVSAEGNVLFTSEKAQYAFVSDIDDTILHTNVLSFLKLKMFFNSFFISATKRKIIKDTPTWYQQLHQNKNPFFYISHSPWNLYDYLLQFLQTHQYPAGTTLLRDFGRKAKDAFQNYDTHKKDETEKLLNRFPHLQFVLIGDGGEKDADIYLELYQKFPQQIKAIFIHRLGDAKHQARIEELQKGKESFFFFIKDVNEAITISKQLGLM